MGWGPGGMLVGTPAFSFFFFSLLQRPFCPKFPSSLSPTFQQAQPWLSMAVVTGVDSSKVSVVVPDRRPWRVQVLP
jgi:hypothetical protein